MSILSKLLVGGFCVLGAHTVVWADMQPYTTVATQAQEVASPDPAPATLDPSADLPPLEEQTLAENPRFAALKKIQDYMAETQRLKADFIQRSPNGNIVEGTLYLAKPGRIRFEYAEDVPFLVVSDGEVLNFIDYEIGQVTKWPVSDTPLRALLNTRLDLTGLGASVDILSAGEKDVISLSAVDDKHPDRGAITLYFKDHSLSGVKDEALELISWTVKDAQGGLTYVELSNQITDPDLDPALWTFKDPRGASKRRRMR
ncbi:hypothetical protein GCM10017044_06910 [Kordiimonas sediminis]|uniref:Outer membrane lipoprotein carrier protein LolA n=1 Tax=Kordiimonas sediminis TaxID=1735581 RepID=A0A919E5L3_9PROT|nr:outer membrane lipoprotein carrier protein LolA [Kordiimonas sediminis]GHF15380.1 hypothetical protein GCM10017044_06910 [Kordiimonas sediminis]